ncbi:MAG: DUF4124 domain-containing protein [Betaproteobacteria bacterium]|nr:DUF4124 domain-containing protein [Betaproteobacteria bacterium]
MKRFFSCLAVCLCVVTPPVSAQVYRCVVNDKVTISTQPCPAGAAVTEYKPEPGAAEREAAAKKAADEEVARMKERVSLMERERREREALLDAARREQEMRTPETAPAPEPVQEGIVERTVIWGPPLYPHPNYHPNPNPYPGRPDASRPPPPRPNGPPNSGNRPGKSSGSGSAGVSRPGTFRPGPNTEPERSSVAPVTTGKAAASRGGATGRAGKP